jgi:cytochrome oxidase Cu insertion factor (SCO1/SenC/PrrC family)
VLRPAVGLLLVLCAVVWVLVQDLGVFGGLGTDPNSMVPFALLVAGGYLAFAYAPAPAAVAAAPAAPGDPVTPPARGWRDRIRPRRLATVIGNASPRTLGAIGALGVAIIGVIPLAAASASASASPILAQALDGSSAPLNFRAPAFTLTNQHGRAVSLASLRGKVVLLTFLDPVCTSDCPLIAQEFRQADQLLAGQSRQVELVAVVTNPLYTQPAYTQAFDRQEHMDTLPNWQYLTGSAAQLKKVWRQYGIAAQVLPAGGMIGHSDIAYVIDRSGRTRTELNFDPGPGTASTQASFAGELSSAARQNLGSS